MGAEDRLGSALHRKTLYIGDYAGRLIAVSAPSRKGQVHEQ